MSKPLDKKAHIRGYLMILFQEGTFERTKTPFDVVARASAAFARDVGEVVGDMATEFGGMGANKLATAAAEIGGRVLSDLAGRALNHFKKSGR